MAVKGPKKLSVTLLFFLFLRLVYSQDGNSTTASTSTVITTTVTLPTTTAAPTDPPSTILPNTDLGVCTCDLTANGCDVNCCCDREDCSTEDIQAFSKCIDNYTPPDRQVCIQRSIIFKDNVPFEKNETDPSLFCVIRDNYEQRNYYEPPVAIDTEEKFDAYRNKYGGSSYMPIGQTESIPTEYYKSGDPILVLYSSLVLGKLGLPRAMLSSECVDNNPAAFLADQSFECVRPLTDVQKQCGTSPSISAQAYYKDFKVIKNPQAVIDIINENRTEAPTTAGYSEFDYGSEATIDLYNSSLVLEIQLAATHTCIDRIGVSTQCNFTADTPTLVDDAGTMYCTNSVVKMEYLLRYNGTAGISSAEVRFTFAELSNAQLPMTQTFSTTFKTIGESGNAFERSGNPGYEIGQPILAGRMTSTTLLDESVRMAIDLNSDRDNWLTIAKASVSGDCDHQAGLRMPVTFGENLRSGCNLALTYNNLTTKVCSLLQEAVIQALVGPDPPTHVATFGNSSPEQTGDWLPILEERRPDGATDTAVGCGSISLGLQVEVMYANVGALGNPQPKVIAVNFRWEEAKEILFQCSGPYCQSGTEDTLTQNFEVVSSVSFIDASSKANGIDAEKPQFTAKLPEDFFYPFS